MKIRSGFVSNSSSSSFVVSAKSSMEVFNKMIPLIKRDYDEYEDGANAWKEYHGAHVKSFKKLHDETFNDGIIIPFTCNYETFIFPVKDGKCYLESCNNHPWEEVFGDFYEDESKYLHYEDDKTKFINAVTGVVTTAKEFTNRTNEELMSKLNVKKEDVSCGFKIGLYMTNDECIQLNVKLEEEGYDLEDYRACTKFLLERSGVYITPDYKVGENKLTHMD